MTNLKFSENLKNALSVNNITQKELADKLKTTQQTVSRWLNGINEPDFTTLIKICVILNETPDTILGFNDLKK